MGIQIGAAWFDALVERPDIVSQLDYIELPGWLVEPVAGQLWQPLILHNLDVDWSLAAHDAFDAAWPDRLAAALARTGSPWFSLHLGFACERVRFDGHMLPVSTPLGRDELLDRLSAAVNHAREMCPVPLLVENLDYCPEGAYEHVCEPAFIAEILERSGVGLLFDLGHWQVSASWLGYDPIEALDQLPLERIVEVHLSSPRPLDDTGRLDDAHAELTDRDLALLGALLERTQPRALTFEYRRDADRLSAQLSAVRELLGERTATISGASR